MYLCSSIIFDKLLQKETLECKWNVIKNASFASAISQSPEAYACIAFHAVVVDFFVFYIESKEEITNMFIEVSGTCFNSSCL